MTQSSIKLSELKEICRSLGVELAACTTVDPLSADAEALRRWQDQGYAADMAYMTREAELLSSPGRLLESARSLVIVGVPYDRRPLPARPHGTGRVARYAWGKDYHKALPKLLNALLERCRAVVEQPITARVFSDAVPLLERALAKRAGLGFIGKNTMLISPGQGSFLFLCEIIWDLDIESDCEPDPRVAKARCGSCSRCVDSCPTGAFVSPYRLDANRCISYLTIENRGAIPRELRAEVGEWLFGCDVCQDVCPFNSSPISIGRQPAVEALGREQGVGPFLSLGELFALRTHEAFAARFGGTAVMRGKRAGLVRNAAVVAANTCAVELLRDLIEVASGDESPIARGHAVWAVGILGARGSGADSARARAAVERAIHDADEGVRIEARDSLERTQ